MLLQFRMYTDEDDLFLRDYRVPGKWTLLEFHQFLTEELNYTPDPTASFFRANDAWEWEDEIPLDDNHPEAQIRIGLLAHDSSRLIYRFDRANDRFMYLEMKGMDAGDGPAEVIFANREAPRQFDSEEDSIFSEAMEEFDDFEGDDQYCDDDE